MKLPTRERDIQKAVLQYLRLRGIFAWRQNTTGRWLAGKNRWIPTASLPGIADVIGCLPGGRFLAIEVKRPGCNPTIEQEAFLKKVKALGGTAACARSVADVETELKNLKGLK